MRTPSSQPLAFLQRSVGVDLMRSKEEEATQVPLPLVKTLRGALRGAGIGRVEITVSGDRVRVELSRAQVERLGRGG